MRARHRHLPCRHNDELVCADCAHKQLIKQSELAVYCQAGTLGQSAVTCASRSRYRTRVSDDDHACSERSEYKTAGQCTCTTSQSQSLNNRYYSPDISNKPSFGNGFTYDNADSWWVDPCNHPTRAVGNLSCEPRWSSVDRALAHMGSWSIRALIRVNQMEYEVMPSECERTRQINSSRAIREA